MSHGITGTVTFCNSLPLSSHVFLLSLGGTLLSFCKDEGRFFVVVIFFLAWGHGWITFDYLILLNRYLALPSFLFLFTCLSLSYLWLKFSSVNLSLHFITMLLSLRHFLYKLNLSQTLCLFQVPF